MEPGMREMTAGELVDALNQERDAGVELRILDAEGNVLVDGVVQMRVTRGSDFDRTGVYGWLVVTGQLEPRSS